MEVILRGDEIPPDLMEFFEEVEFDRMTSTWVLSSEPQADAHFATFPSEIPRRAILAGTSAYGCCGECGAGYRRVVEKQALIKGSANVNIGNGYDHGWEGTPRASLQIETLGWQPSCACPPSTPIPATVLDPFLGSGTTALVAHRLGRHSIGIELNCEYLKIQQKRFAQASLELIGADTQDTPDAAHSDPQPQQEAMPF